MAGSGCWPYGCSDGARESVMAALAIGARAASTAGAGALARPLTTRASSWGFNVWCKLPSACVQAPVPAADRFLSQKSSSMYNQGSRPGADRLSVPLTPLPTVILSCAETGTLFDAEACGWTRGPVCCPVSCCAGEVEGCWPLPAILIPGFMVQVSLCVGQTSCRPLRVPGWHKVPASCHASVPGVSDTRFSGAG